LQKKASRPASLARPLRHNLIVTKRDDIPSQHHRVVLVDQVMAVYRVSPQEIPEPEEEIDSLVVLQSGHVLPGYLSVGWRQTIARKNLVLFKVDMNRVLPVTGQV
jgi:hypothetical protein